MGLQAIISFATSKKPVLTVIEDIHWADMALLSRLGALASLVTDHPMILVFTTRLDEAMDDLSWRGPASSAPFMTFDLGPLRQSEAIELASQSLVLMSVLTWRETAAP